MSQNLSFQDLILPQNMPLLIGLSIGLLLIIGLVTVIALLMRKP